MKEYEGNEIPKLNIYKNNDDYSFIHNEIKNNDKIPKFHKNNELCFILFSDQEKYIILKKNNEIMEFEEENDLKKNNSINNFNVSEIVLKSFKKKYSKTFKDLKDLEIKKYYQKHSSGNYESIIFDDSNSITNINFIIYVDIYSTQVWVPTNITITIFSHYSININSNLKLDRFTSEIELKKILIKSLIAIFNNVACIEDNKLSNQNNYDINELLHFHFLIHSYKMDITSFENFIWDNNKSNNFNINISINASFIILEEGLFKIIKNIISKISIQRVNMLWNDFIELKNYNEFKNNNKFENEFNTFNNDVRRLIFNLGKKENCYLYYSKKSFSQCQNDYNSYSSFNENLKIKNNLNFIFLPQVDEIKKKTNKKNVEKIEEMNINLNKGNQKNTNKKKLLIPLKHFEESFEEPLVKKWKNEENNNEIEKNNNKKFENENENNNENTINNITTIPKKKIGNKTIKNDEELFKNVIEKTKSYYKEYSKEQFSKDFEMDLENIQNYNNNYNGLCKVIQESRQPSHYLLLDKQISSLINIKSINKFFNEFNFLKLEKNELDKYYLPKIIVDDYSFLIIKDEKYSKEKVSLSSPKCFTIEILFICFLFISVIVLLYLLIDKSLNIVNEIQNKTNFRNVS